MWFTVILIYIRIVASDENLHTVWFNTISKFHDEYPSTSIFIAQNKIISNLEVSNALVTMMKKFSDENVLAMIARITDIPRTIQHCHQLEHRHLFVLILESVTDLDTFTKMTRIADLNMHRTLVLFSKNISDICYDLVGNPFNLIFDSKMLVKCENSSIIQERYSIHANTTKVIDLFAWEKNLEKFMKLTSLGFYERRNSLEGIGLRVITKSDYHLKGIFAQVLMEISQVANFKIQIEHYDEKEGSYNPDTKRWSGLIGRLQQKQADIGLTLLGLTMTHNRLKSVDFSKPIFISRSAFYIKKLSKSRSMWWMYYNAFGIEAAYCLLITLIGSPIILTVIIAKQNQISYRMILYNNYLYVWGIFCINSLPEPSKNLSTKIACVSLLITAYVLYSIYSTLLVSYMTVFKPDLPFHSLEEFVDAKTHRIMTYKNTSLIDSFKSSNDTMMKKLKTFFLDISEMPDTFYTISKQVCNSDNNLALFENDIRLKSAHVNYPCELISFGTGMLNNECLAFSKGSPYKGLINYYLQRMQDSGILDTLIQRNLKSPQPEGMGYKAVTLRSILPIFAILGAGISLSLLIFFCENFLSLANQFDHMRNRSTGKFPWTKWISKAIK